MVSERPDALEFNMSSNYKTGEVLRPALAEFIVQDAHGGWEAFDDEPSARDAFSTAVAEAEDNAGEGGGFENADTIALYRLVPVSRTKVVIQGISDEDTIEGAQCRELGWDFIGEIETEDFGGAA